MLQHPEIAHCSRVNRQCSMLAVTTAEGLVAWHLVTHLPQPEWAPIPPNCLVEDDVITAVRNQVRHQALAIQSQSNLTPSLASM